MYQHVLLVHSDYSKGKRIAFHKCYQNISDIKEFMSLSSQLKDKFKHLTFSFHHIQTMEKSTNSIVEYDKFFADMEFYSDFHQFISLIEEDIAIKPIDVAKIILSKRECSHLELQKMIYFAYCEYMSIYDEPMFIDDFQAWKYGPVVPDVYYTFDKYKDKKIKGYGSEESLLRIYSRIIKIDKYEKVMHAIDLAIKKYGNLTPSQLVDESHIKDGPWDKVYQNGKGQNGIIDKDLIREYMINKQAIIA